MLNRNITWLLAGAAFTLCAGVSVATAAVDPAEAVRQAQEDAKAAREEADRLRDDSERMRDRAEAARERAQEAREKAREQVREARSDWRGRHGDVVVYSSGGRSQTLKDILQLRPDQEPALTAFLEATRPSRGSQEMVRFDHRHDDQRTTLQRLDEMSARAAEQKAATDRRIGAVRAFYGQLDEKQRRAFDAMPMMMMVGPNIGPMMIPRVMPIAAIPPTPPMPPVPPIAPRSPRG